MSDLTPMVQATIKERGQTVTLRRVTEGSYDPATGTTAVATTDDESALVYFEDYSLRLVDGTNVQRGDRKALVSPTLADGTALTKAPQTGDQIVGEGETVNVVDVQTIHDGTTALLYICQVRE